MSHHAEIALRGGNNAIRYETLLNMNITTIGGTLLITACLGLAGCSSDSDESASTPTASPSFSSTDSPSDALTVTAKDFGPSWPFTVNDGTIHCTGQAAWFRTDGKNYPLNSVAQSEQQQGTATVNNPQSGLQTIIKSPGAEDPLTGEVAEYADPQPITGTAADMCGAT